jgi:ribosomal protein L12E/L44/L45/RPP1/RPP2
MTITINLPPATLDQLKAEAQATGKDVETVVREAVEVKMALLHVSIQEVIRPINEAIAASGMSPQEAEAFFEQELAAMRAERKSSSGKQ